MSTEQTQQQPQLVEIKTSEHEFVMRPSEPLAGFEIPVRGYDFNQGVDYEKIMKSFYTTGFQATHYGQAVETVNQMLTWRLSDDPIKEDEDDYYKNPENRANTRATIFLGYTSNLVSSGDRETIRYLAQHKLVDVILSTAGGIEEDFIKCLGNTYVGEFHTPGAGLRQKGWNRIGNLFIPNENYVMFENWVFPIFDKMLEEQKTQGVNWTPSKIIARLGKEINNPDSIYYWCYKNNIPVYSPALTDGSLGDIIYFHSYKNPGLIVDIAEDVRGVNRHAIFAKKSGVLICGGGVVKHHILNANMMRNGADWAVYMNTAQEFDGSDSGARPDEAVSWGKIRMDAKPVKVYGECSMLLPLLVAETFVKEKERRDAVPVKPVPHLPPKN